MTEKKANVTNTQKLKTVILSVFLAVIVWFMVIYVNDPDITTTVSDLNVRFVGEMSLRDKKLAVTGKDKIPELSVVVTGKRSDLMNFMDDIYVQVDVSDIDSTGEYNLSGVISIPTTRISVEKEKYGDIPITVEPLEMKDIEVTVKQTGMLKDKIVKSTHAYSDVEALIATDVNPCEISQTNTSPKEMTLLIIEDNEDVRNYLVSLLSKYYNIYTAVNCKEGYEIEQKQIPDLVISDIMTPYMDGIEFTRLSKNNMVTSHIPIILLTARVTSSQVREGYESLADDYIMKPFDPELLVVRVANLLINRKKLAERYGTEMVSINREPQKAKETSVYSAMEEKFMKKVMEIINKNIENPAYSIDQFSEEIGMSRVQVYRKIKAVTGMSPSKLILDIRLKTSLDMLQNTEYTVTEVSYRCGFNEISYFGKCFKTEYGLSPSEYIKKYRK